MRILAVDDDEIALSVLQHALTEAGYDVITASDGREAMKRMTQSPAKIVISDWMMPEMSGIELCRSLRARSNTGYVYFILLTARDGTRNIVEALTAGADEFLTKPFSHAELIVRVRAAERILSLDTRDLTIFALAKLAESRDHETGQHLERVRLYARLLADDLSAETGQAPDFARLIYLTSPLHDIGKVGIPDRVLLKPGPLDKDEFDIMKTHTLLGAETLDAAVLEYPDVPFLQTAKDIALTHHERYDGNGYPSGLEGEEIPWSGRIVAVADVYDALTSKRVYKEALGHDKARGIIMSEAGRHFDPTVVASFARNDRQFLGIRSQFSDAARQTLASATT